MSDFYDDGHTSWADDDDQLGITDDNKVAVDVADMERFAASGSTDLREWLRSQRGKPAAAPRPPVRDFTGTEDPVVRAKEVKRRIVAAGGRDSDGLAAYFETILEAGAAGDPRVVIPPGEFRRSG